MRSGFCAQTTPLPLAETLMKSLEVLDKLPCEGLEARLEERDEVADVSGDEVLARSW